MTTSKTSIANMALAHIGSSLRLSSLSDPTNQAAVVNLFYDQALREALAASPWGFAAQTDDLALLAETIGNWSYAYGFPSNAVSIRDVVREGQTGPAEPEDQVKYDVVSSSTGTKAIVSDYPLVSCLYTKVSVDEAMYPPMFVGALTYLLASKIAMPLTKDKPLALDLHQAYLTEMSRASADDKNQRQRLRSRGSRSLRARTGSALADYGQR